MTEHNELLSPREMEVLEQVSLGLANKEIAQKLTISENTVKVHLRNIYGKLEVSSRTEATTQALQLGILTLPGQEPEEPEPEPEEAETAVSVPDSDPKPETSPRPPRPVLINRQTAILIAVMLVAVVAIGLFSLQTLGEPSAPTPTPEPFTEEPMGDTLWLRSRPMPAGAAHMAVAAVGLDVYQIGGETAAGVVSSVRVFDTTRRQWQEAAAKPTAVADVSAAVLFGEIYVPGGRLVDGRPTDVVEAYSPANDAWRPIAPLPQPVAGGLALSDGGFLYLIGGWSGEAYLDTAFVYDPASDQWQPLTPMAHSRAFAAGQAVTGRLYVVGGFDGRSELDVCQFYDPVAEAWFDCPPMLTPRARAGAAVILNQLYIIGGGLDAANPVTDSEVFDPENEVWELVETPLLDLSPAWAGVGVTNVETRLYALGGYRGESLSDETLVYVPYAYKTFIPAASGGSENNGN